MLAERDPQRALARAEELARARPQFVVQVILQRWAQRDVRAAAGYVESILGFAMTLDDESERSNTVRNALRQWSSRDPRAAAEWA